jgi:hypothetical protein
LSVCLLSRAAVQYCPAGATTACARVLVVGAVPAAWLADVQSTLRGTGAFATVDTFAAQSASDGGSGTPSAALLAGYVGVLAYSWLSFAVA